VALPECDAPAGWTEPSVEWRLGTDCAAYYQWLVEHAERLVTWPPAPFEDTATDCFRVGNDYCVWQPGIGGVRFSQDRPEFIAFPSSSVDPESFKYLITRSWLPAVYQVWGRQVLHASAVAATQSADVVAFAGPTQAGKSTLAYGLAQRAGWQLVCDDTLSFSSDNSTINLHPLPNESRLRPLSAAHYGRTESVPEPVVWPERPLHLRAVFFLAGDSNHRLPVAITRLKAADAYSLLLGQAFALTFKLPKHNQQLMREYLALAASVPVYRLAYRKSFDVMDEIFDVVEESLRTA